MGLGGAPSVEEVPVIDLRNTDDEVLVKQIAEACRVYGFFQITNHGVEGIDHFREVCRSWFTSDKPKKRRNGTNARGYFDDELTKQVRASEHFFCGARNRLADYVETPRYFS